MFLCYAYGMEQGRTYETSDVEPVTAARVNSVHGRGAVTNDSGRFERFTRVPFHSDTYVPGLQNDSEKIADRLSTEILPENPKKILTKNMSPDVPFDQSINPYRGCEHGCTYCFARPSHSYMGLSAGQDFETRIFVKKNAADVLRRELSAKSYKMSPIAFGTNTDPYQPLEKTAANYQKPFRGFARM